MKVNVWLYLASAGASMLGNSVVQIVWPWLVLNRTGDPAAAGMVATVIAVPALLFAIVGGHLIDSVGRRRMSVVSDVVSSASVASVVVVDHVFGLNLWWFIALGIVGAVGDIPGMAARNALITDIAKDSGVTVSRLSGFNQSLVGITFLLGPALAGALMSVLSIELVLWITAACSLLAAVLTALLRLSNEAPVAEEEVFQGWRAWGSLLQIVPVRMLAVMTLVSGMLVGPLLTVLLPAQFESLGQPVLLGLSMSSFAVGMIVISMAVSALGLAYRRRAWIIAIALLVISFGCTAFLDTTWLVFLGMFAAGLGSGLTGPISMLVVTEETPEHMRGRAFSLFTAINLFATPIGLSLATLALKFYSIYWLAVALLVVWLPVAAWAIVRGARVLPHYRSASLVE